MATAIRSGDYGSTLAGAGWAWIFWGAVALLVAAGLVELRWRKAQRAAQVEACRHYMRPIEVGSTGTVWKCQLCPSTKFVRFADRDKSAPFDREAEWSGDEGEASRGSMSPDQ